MTHCSLPYYPLSLSTVFIVIVDCTREKYFCHRFNKVLFNTNVLLTFRKQTFCISVCERIDNNSNRFSMYDKRCCPHSVTLALVVITRRLKNILLSNKAFICIHQMYCAIVTNHKNAERQESRGTTSSSIQKETKYIKSLSIYIYIHTVCIQYIYNYYISKSFLPNLFFIVLMYGVTIPSQQRLSTYSSVIKKEKYSQKYSS